MAKICRMPNMTQIGSIFWAVDDRQASYKKPIFFNLGDFKTDISKKILTYIF